MKDCSNFLHVVIRKIKFGNIEDIANYPTKSDIKGPQFSEKLQASPRYPSNR